MSNQTKMTIGEEEENYWSKVSEEKKKEALGNRKRFKGRTG